MLGSTRALAESLYLLQCAAAAAAGCNSSSSKHIVAIFAQQQRTVWGKSCCPSDSCDLTTVYSSHGRTGDAITDTSSSCSRDSWSAHCLASKISCVSSSSSNSSYTSSSSSSSSSTRITSQLWPGQSVVPRPQGSSVVLPCGTEAVFNRGPGHLQCSHAAGHAAFSTSSCSHKGKRKSSTNSTTTTTTTTSNSSSGSGGGSGGSSTAAAPLHLQVAGAIDPKLSDLMKQSGLDVLQQGFDQWVQQHQQMAQHPFQKGQVLGGGRYQLTSKPATRPSPVKGQLATLWEGQDLQTQRSVMLKCQEAGGTDSYSAGMREAALHAAAGRCPNIVGLTDAFEHRSSSGRHPVMVWHPTGDSLATVVRRYKNPYEEGTLYHGICDSPTALKRIARDLLTALDYLHKRGIVHTNLSLGNVVLDRKWVPAEQLRKQIRLNSVDKALQAWMWLQAGYASVVPKDKKHASMLLFKLAQQTNDRVRLQCELDGVHSEVTLSDAVFRLTDLSQAAVLTSSLPYSPEGFRMDSQARAMLRQRQLYNTDGSPVKNDPTYQAPEEIFGWANYVAPAYDMWQFGCLMYEAASGTKLFTAQLREVWKKVKGDLGYGDQHYMLASMVNTLGHVPPKFGRKAPRREFFYQSAERYDPNTDMLAIHAGPLSHRAGKVPLEALLAEKTALNDGRTINLKEDTDFATAEAKPFADFLLQVLRWEPDSRATAEQLLQHAWLQPTPHLIHTNDFPP